MSVQNDYTEHKHIYNIVNIRAAGLQTTFLH